MAWQKLLYVSQNVPDNYTHKSFLNELRKNEHLRIYEYWTLVAMTTSFLLQLNSILIFVALFVAVYNQDISSSKLVILAESSTFFGYITWMIYVRLRGAEFRYEGKQTAKCGIILIIILLAVSPILKTLTEDISSDSIWTMTTFCFVTNLCLNDYKMSSAWKGIDASAIAINAAVCACVILASRLPSNLHVFGLVSLGVNWFGLLPLYSRVLRRFSLLLYHIVLSFCLSIGTLISIAMIHRHLAIVYVFVYGLILLGIPFTFLKLQRFKKYLNEFI